MVMAEGGLRWHREDGGRQGREKKEGGSRFCAACETECEVVVVLGSYELDFSLDGISDAKLVLGISFYSFSQEVLGDENTRRVRENEISQYSMTPDR